MTPEEMTPRPDPTVRTVDVVHREVRTLEEKFSAGLEALRNFTAEKFCAVEALRVLTEAQRLEQKQDTKVAVDAALAAQKEAVKEQTTASGLSIAKSETATMESLKQLTNAFTTAISGVNSSVADLKERIVTIETSRHEGAGQVDTRRQNLTANTNVIMAVVAIGAIALSIFTLVAR